MSEMNRKLIGSLPEFIATIQDIQQVEQADFWFRGHRDARHRLLPGAYRSSRPYLDARGNRLAGDQFRVSTSYTAIVPNADRWLQEFKRRALPFVRSTPRNDFEWMFLAQHYGVPTRLLDWTTNALVALYFALRGEIQERVEREPDNESLDLSLDDHIDAGAAAVFVVNPRTIQAQAHGEPGYPVAIADEADRWSHYLDPAQKQHADMAYFPLCVLAPHLDERLRNQSSVFTLHGFNLYSIDYYDVLRPSLHQLIIPHHAVEPMRHGLRQLGMTTSVVFPDLAGVAEEVTMDGWRRWQQGGFRGRFRGQYT